MTLNSSNKEEPPMRKLSFSHDYKMAIDVNVSKNGRNPQLVGPVIDQRPVQGASFLSSYDSWHRF